MPVPLFTDQLPAAGPSAINFGCLPGGLKHLDRARCSYRQGTVHRGYLVVVAAAAMPEEWAAAITRQWWYGCLATPERQAINENRRPGGLITTPSSLLLVIHNRTPTPAAGNSSQNGRCRTIRRPKEGTQQRKSSCARSCW